MICNGFKRAKVSKSSSADEGNEFKLLYTNADVLRICKTQKLSDFVVQQQSKYLAHLCRQPHQTLTKQLLFNDDKYSKRGNRCETLEEQVMNKLCTTPEQFYKLALERKTDTLFKNLNRQNVKSKNYSKTKKVKAKKE